MTTKQLDPIASGTWAITMPNGMAATFRIDADANRWGLDVYPPGKRDRAISAAGTLDDAAWFALGVAVGAIPYPDLD